MAERAFKKLEIKGWKNPEDVSKKPKKIFTAYLNPEEFKRSYEFEYNEEGGSGSTGAALQWGKITPQKYTLKLPIDGTGAAGKKIEVDEKIEEFYAVVNFSGESHKPYFLAISWGKILVYCVLTRVDVTYKLFSPDGTPLRAVIDATFTASMEDQLRARKENKESPDLLHIHMVKAGEMLPALCDQYYGDPARYLQVAQVNNLDNFRDIAAGTQIIFPPIEKEAR